VQAYQKRAPDVIDWVRDAAAAHGRRLMVRLGEGRLLGHRGETRAGARLAGYPGSPQGDDDLSYMACVTKLLAARPRLYPQFATHNALTVASVIEEAGGVDGYNSSDCTHGRGGLRGRDRGRAGRRMPRLCAGRRASRSFGLSGAAAARERREFVVRVGGGRSGGPGFADSAAAAAWIAAPSQARHPRIPLPRDLMERRAKIPPAVEFGDRASLAALLAEVRGAAPRDAEALPLIDGVARAGKRRAVASPIDDALLGTSPKVTPRSRRPAMAAAQNGFPAWAVMPVSERAAMLERAAAALEANRGKLIALLQAEGGKTLDDALSEVREATDFCRYYAPRRAAHWCRSACQVRPERRTSCIIAARRFRLHQPVEFPARDFPRAGGGGAGRRK